MMYAKFIGITAETAALIETRRQGPKESEDDILRRTLAPTVDRGADSEEPVAGCDLGQGAVLREGERLYFFRHKRSRDAEKPEAIAESRNSSLYLYGQKVERSKGSLVQPALRMVQERLDDRNPKGEFISLDAWDYWYVRRHKVFLKVGMLRDQEKIVRRGRYISDKSAEELGL